MANLNQCFFIGNLGGNPEEHTTEGGLKWVSFRLAVNKRKKDEKPMWLSIVCWEELAKFAKEYLFKGTLVFVQGRLQVRNYKNQSDIQRQTIDIVASNIQLLGAKAQREEITEEVKTGMIEAPTRGVQNDLL